ncbi:hypothetical protein CDD81_2458 [Ophiocordyceps australis]|uniref:DNA repair protein Rad26 n=1 Tax=Ophiocordyceps australis TaxID=1399860 RepID=A0A2C5XY00_9HYPO|nr:hypothetical protein CDD81_2458 [Ophiocordyceps australis]
MTLDDFSDDDFPDLTDNALQELERNAIQLTQAKSPRQSTYPDYGWEDEDDDLDTTEVTNIIGLPIARPVVDNALLQPHAKQPHSDSRLHFSSAVPEAKSRWNAAAAGLAVRPRQSLAASQRLQAPAQSQGHDIVSALQRRVRSLEAELNASRGENSIIRANLTKTRSDHEAHIARLQAEKANQVAEKQRIADAALEAHKNANTELQFMQRDLREVSDRARRKDPAAPSGLATPRKANKSWTLADGFDHMDIVVSPSKAMGRSRGSGPVAAHVGERTPSKGKRKRPPIDSPVAELDIDMQDAVVSPEKPAAAPVEQANTLVSHGAPLDFLQLVLDHGAFYQQPPTFDTLSRYTLPADPTETSLASMIFEKLPLMGHPGRPMQLLVDFAEHIMSLWTSCVQQGLWEPIKHLVALVSFTLDLHASSVAPHVVSSLVPAAQQTIRELAQRRHPCPDGRHEYSLLQQHIDTHSIFGLLLTAAMACATWPSETPDGFRYTAVEFWRLVCHDTVLLLLSPKQNLEDTIAMLDLLALSPLPDSIGPVSQEIEPVTIARDVIERVSSKLMDSMRSPMRAKQRRMLHLAALRTLIAFARYPFGALQLASHDYALPRLVMCLCRSIDHLYDQSVCASATSSAKSSRASRPLASTEPTASAQLHRIISQSLLLIHTLVTDPNTSNAAEISHKLSMIHGGSQRYILALGRLTFADEDHAIEAAISGDVVDAAHELLELAVTPDEGETVSEAFGA